MSTVNSSLAASSRSPIILDSDLYSATFSVLVMAMCTAKELVCASNDNSVHIIQKEGF